LGSACIRLPGVSQDVITHLKPKYDLLDDDFVPLVSVIEDAVQLVGEKVTRDREIMSAYRAVKKMAHDDRVSIKPLAAWARPSRLLPPQQFRQLGDVGCYAPGFVAPCFFIYPSSGASTAPCLNISTLAEPGLTRPSIRPVMMFSRN
jgi:hypothetical protein